MLPCWCFFAMWGLYNLSISSILPWNTMEEKVIMLTPESQYNSKGRGWEEHYFCYISAHLYSLGYVVPIGSGMYVLHIICILEVAYVMSKNSIDFTYLFKMHTQQYISY